MNIANRMYRSKQILPKSNNSGMVWSIIFFIDAGQKDLDNLGIFYKDTVGTLCNETDIGGVYIYTYLFANNLYQFQKMADLIGAKLVDLSINDSYQKLSIINKHLQLNENIIFFTNDHGYAGGFGRGSRRGSEEIFENNNDIYATMYEKDNINERYLIFLQKFATNYIISTDTIVVPFSQQNATFFGNVLQTTYTINSTDQDFATNLGLTVVNLHSGNIIKKIGNEFVSFGKDKIIFRTLRETPHKNNMILPSFNSHEYIYYPYLDLDGEVSENAVSNVFNTNGFFINLPSNTNHFEKMFQRFDNGMSGIFYKKESNEVIVPKILHHVWLDIPPDTNYTNAWKRILRQPWQYMLWTNDTIEDFFSKSGSQNKNNWQKLYQTENNLPQKMLIVYLAILEAYGGFVVDSSSLPLRMIPDDLLTKKFMLGFMNEKIHGTKLSYRLMASVPGRKPNVIDKIETDFDPARKPFEGANNFFREIKLKNKLGMKSTPVEDDDIISYPHFYDNMYQILSTKDDNKFESIESHIKSDNNGIIYPSYYFNHDIYDYPKILRNRTITTSVVQTKNNKINNNKTELKREYIVNEAGILAKLNENPRDRLKNMREI